MKITCRLDANLGYECNNDCLFCYFRGVKRNCVNKSTEECKALFRKMFGQGVKIIEITGGEPTIRDDFLELVSYAKKLGFEGITVITNGSRFCDPVFTMEAVKRGVDDVLVSIHGPDRKTHDMLTDRKGAFEDVLKTIENVQNVGASCRTNTVVNKFNHEKVSQIAQLVYSFGVKKMNFIFFSPLDDAGSVTKDLWVTYSKAAPWMTGMIDAYHEKLETISVKVIPFCFLEGYEDYVTNLYQNLYDPYEWDFYLRVGIRRGAFARDIASVAGILFLMDIKRFFKIGWKKSLREGIIRVQAKRECIKTLECGRCRLEHICPGVWKEYARVFGTKEIKALKGDDVRQIEHFLDKRFAACQE